MIKKIVLSLILCLVLTGNFFAKDLSGETIVYDFTDNWLRYDKFYESYLPLKTKELKGSKSIHQILNFEKYKKYDLQFQAQTGLALFVNNKLVYKKIDGDEEKIRMSMEKFESGENGEIIITFFHPKGNLPFSSTAIINNSISMVERKNEEGPSTLLQARVSKDLPSYLLLFISIVTLFVGFKKVYPKEYVRYFSFTFQESADHLLPGSFSIPSLWMALVNGLALALLVNMLGLNDNIFATHYSFFKSIVLITGAYFVFYIGKYIYLWVIAWLFNYSKIVSPQFAEYIRFFERVCLLFCVVVFGLVASGFITLNIKPEILYFSLIMVFIFCVVKVIFLFFRLISHRNLYLFSYLCAAEILPLIIAVKILLF